MLRKQNQNAGSGWGEVFIFSRILFRHRAVWIAVDKVALG